MIYGDVDGKFVCNTIFVQPTNLCAKKCEGCYVKAHCHGPQMDPQEHTRFLRMLWFRENIVCNQITISMDSLRTKSTDYNGDADHIMRECTQFTTAQTTGTLPTIKPEIHLTFNNVQDYRRYNFRPRLMDGINVVTFSHIDMRTCDDRAEIKEIQLQGVKVNYNYSLLCEYPGMMSDEKVDRELEAFETILTLVDSVYMLVWKEPVGKVFDMFSLNEYKERLRKNLKWADYIQSEFRSPKIMMDTCVKDVLEYKKCGYGCAANVSRFQVWPDGSVSGCPYALQSCTTEATTAEKVIYNIRKKARESYDWDKCVLRSLI